MSELICSFLNNAIHSTDYTERGRSCHSTSEKSLASHCGGLGLLPASSCGISGGQSATATDNSKTPLNYP
jgi:hypothetical protein